jgi:murein DD-endopeptidase MepM/ murein hydrolase activator NlpD
MTAAMGKRLIAVALVAGALVALGGGAAQAQMPVRHSVYARYIDPFAAPGWVPNRTDMGVDWLVTRPLPVLAIGNAVIVGSDSNDTGWPGGHFIWYRLLDGSHAGDIIYVAEHLRHLLPAGEYVRAGQKIAEALPGGTGTEWGWADADGSTRAHPCYHEGEQTASGEDMARFMKSLGATVGDPPGRGPNAPFGKLC